MILIVVLWALAVLSLLALGFAYRCQLELRVTDFQFRRNKALYLAKSAVNAALLELMKDDNEYDAPGEEWHQPHYLEKEISAKKDERLFPDSAGISVVYRIEDEDGKINLNSATREMLEKAAGELTGVILDWRDPDESEEWGGAESIYYMSRNPAYPSKNGPFEAVEEMLLLKGMTRELFFGKETDSAPDDENTPGFKDIFTVYGDGRINLNTAPAEVLKAIPGVKEATVEALLQYRRGSNQIDGDDDDRPLKEIGELKKIGYLNDYEFGLLAGWGKVRSSVFKVTAVASVDGGAVSQQIVAVLEKVTPQARIISWREE